MWPQMTQWAELKLMEGGGGMSAHGMLQPVVSIPLFTREHEFVCECVCVRSCGVEWGELQTHIWLRGLSQGHKPTRAEWLKFSETQEQRLKYLGVRPHWVDGETEQVDSNVTMVFFYILLPEVCPPLSVPMRTASLPPRRQACWGCMCWKCRSWACVFAVSQRWTNRFIRNSSKNGFSNKD